MFKLVFLLLLVVGLCYATEPPEVLKADSSGIIVELREKYGPVIYDTGTVILIYKNNFIVTKKSGTAWYPKENYSCKILAKTK